MCRILGISEYEFKQARKHWANKSIPIHGNLGKSFKKHLTQKACQWFQQVCNLVAEPQPDREYYHLPMSYKKYYLILLLKFKLNSL